jgi:F0F1-type ATP synthase delta subunit
MDTTLRGYAIAVLQNAVAVDGGADAVARDLRQVTDAISESANLAQVLTDVMIPAQARRAVTDDLLSGRITAAALRLVSQAIASERADGLLSVLGELAELALHFAEFGSVEFEEDEPLFGRVGARRLAAGYATAVLEDVSDSSELEAIEGELFSFSRTVGSSDGLRSALADSSRPIGDRRRLISDLLDGKARPVAIRLARAAIQGRSRDPQGSLDWMAERVAEERGWRVARVSSARGLDDAERQELGSALQSLTGRPVELLVTDNQALLGGAVIAIGNLLVDASAQHRLDQLQEELLGSDSFANSSFAPGAQS